MDPATAPLERHREAVRARLASAGLSASAPGTVSWRINREIIVVVGWGRAILLQFAHPLVASGVNDHSNFRGSLLSSVRRLQSTAGAMLSLTFGGEDEAIAAAAGINAIHDRVYGRLAGPVGVYPAGEHYSAHDPELLRWVHATLLESVPMTYELLVGPLTREDRDRYCAEAAIMEPMLDIPRGLLPRNTGQLGDYMRGMMHGGRIAVSETSRALARAVLFPPRWQLLWPAFRAAQLITIGLLPPKIREAYGFRWHARDVDAFVRWTRVLRHVHHALPPVMREWPMARRAAGRRL
jgi:uncharacterized protein (DUF2236 family)